MKSCSCVAQYSLGSPIRKSLHVLNQENFLDCAFANFHSDKLTNLTDNVVVRRHVERKIHYFYKVFPVYTFFGRLCVYIKIPQVLECICLAQFISPRNITRGRISHGGKEKLIRYFDSCTNRTKQYKTI